MLLAAFSVVILLCSAGCTAPVSEETISAEVFEERVMANYAIYSIEVTNDGLMAVSGVKLNVTLVEGPENNPRQIASQVVDVDPIGPGESTSVVVDFTSNKLSDENVRVLIEVM